MDVCTVHALRLNRNCRNEHKHHPILRRTSTTKPLRATLLLILVYVVLQYTSACLSMPVVCALPNMAPMSIAATLTQSRAPFRALACRCTHSRPEIELVRLTRQHIHSFSLPRRVIFARFRLLVGPNLRRLFRATARKISYFCHARTS